MSSNFTDNTNRFASSAITHSLDQLVLPRADFHGSRVVAAPYSLHGNTLPPYAGPLSGHRIFATSYGPQKSLLQKFQTEMDLDPNRQQLFATIETVHGTGESHLAAAYHLIPVYRNNHIFTGTYPEPQPLFTGEFINTAQPSYHWCNSEVGSIQQSIAMEVEGSISANHYRTLSSENTSSLTTLNTAYNGVTSQGISDLAAANHLMPVYGVVNLHNLASTYNVEHKPFCGAFMDSVRPSWKSPITAQQTPYHAPKGQADHPGNLGAGNLQQSPTIAVEVPTSANYCQVTLAENTNSNVDGKESSKYFCVADGNTLLWRCNIDDCEYVSRFKRDIKRHCSNLGHGGSRDHKCEFCGKAFGRKDVIKRHVTQTRCWLRQAQVTMPEGDLCRGLLKNGK